MSGLPTRRDLVKLSAAGMAAAHASAAPPPAGEITVRVTAGEKRYAEAPALRWQRETRPAAGAVTLDAGKSYQEVLGFGAALTDAACYMFNELSPGARERILHRLFHPSEMNLSACRICIGSSDYATEAYSYDEGEPDPEMKRFSIDHDRKWIIPILKAARAVNPDLFLFASPWSPPGWMKANGSMLGGSMMKSSFAPYAKYFVRFLQSYAEAGVPVDAVSVQNEVDTAQDSRMPACLWGQEYEREFVAAHLGPQLAANNLKTKIWIIDHNYDLWGRAICELDYPETKKYVDGVAWHGYAGHPSGMTRVHDAHPTIHAYWTEGGPDIRERDYRTNWVRWSRTFTDILRNWARAIIGWNMALDENGKPNIGPFSCGGLITIDSRTKEITESGQYWALAHYSRAVRRGAKRIESTGDDVNRVSHVAFVNPDGSSAAILTNNGQATTVRVRMSGMETKVEMPAGSVVTLAWA